VLALLLSCTTQVAEAWTPRPAEWAQVERDVFQAAWILPEEVWQPGDASRSLAASLGELAAARFDAPAESAWMSSLGDFVLEHRRRGSTRSELERLLAELKSTRPATHERLAPFARETLAPDALASRSWDPDQDRADDGVYFGPLLRRRASKLPPWSTHEELGNFHQAATLVHADLEAWLSALHDYQALARDPGTSYERLRPQQASFLTGEDAQHGPFAALRLVIRSDLPFPFSHYDCDLRVLHRLGRGRHLETFVYSSSEDFYWFAGRDLHLPVRASDGRWVATLLVRVAGFDLRGVPDDDQDRQSGTRAALGNLRRRAEAEFERAGRVPRTVDSALPELRLVPPRAR